MASIGKILRDKRQGHAIDNEIEMVRNATGLECMCMSEV